MSFVEGWKTEPLGRVARLTMGQSPDSKYYSEEENGLPFVQGCAEFKGRFPKHSLYCSQTKKIATVGSILFSVRAPVGRINIADRDYIIGRGLAGISGIEVDQAYLEHYLTFVESNFRNASQGSTFEAINSSELNGWPIEHPVSKPEQTKIAEILSTVDRAIEQTEALIAKQQRIKTGLMQDLLTRGIDEHGNLRSEQTHKFKDSPLGRIPVEWEVKTFADITPTDAPIGYGIVQPGAYDFAGVKVAGIYTINSDFNLWHISSQKIEQAYVRSRIKSGDVLLSIKGTTGRVGVVPSKTTGNISREIARIRPVKTINPYFLRFLMLSDFFQQYLGNAEVGTTRAEISIKILRVLYVLVPPRSEQDVIVSGVTLVERTLERSHRELSKLRSIKTALMQELLTGKKRVTALLHDAEVPAA